MRSWGKTGVAWLTAAVLLMAAVPAAGAENGMVVEADGKVTLYDIESGESLAELMDDTVPDWMSDSVETPAAPVDGDVAADAPALDVGGKSALLMELSSGQVLFEKNADERLPIASVTKVMTLLLIMEAIDDAVLNYDDPVTCSAYAASMGGSQIWLEEGEIMTVHELLKAIAVVSANDACAMMAERISGSEEGFVACMNERAAELGMENTHFTDCCGLDESAYSSARDVAIMSRELMKHSDITKYTTIWMDSLRGGASELVNTNKLVRFYEGITGLKTGTTSQAGHCLSATAQRDGLGLVSVILGCETTAERFGGARKMLDYGFANYAIYTPEVDPAELTPIPVLRGVADTVTPMLDALQPLLIKKGQESKIERQLALATDLEAPVLDGQVVGTLTLSLDGTTLAQYDVRATDGVERLGWRQALWRLFAALIA